MINPAIAALAGWEACLPVGVAYSGGADSSALLRGAVAHWPGQVHALHVHHGLQPAADDFARHCASTCAALGVPFHAARVDARHAPGDSPEEAARDARYVQLAALARDAGLQHVLLGQHADDQVETMLIALGRGAGVDGLAGMPRQADRHGVTFHRPLLGVRAIDLRGWLDDSGLGYVEDPTNIDPRHPRNRIRRLVLPALETAMPQFRETFARSARNAGRAAGLLAELGADDLARVGVPPRIEPLRGLSRERRANVLRWWLKREHAAVPSEVQLMQLLDQLEACTTRGHAIHLKVAHGQVRREGLVLRWYNSAPSAARAAQR